MIDFRFLRVHPPRWALIAFLGLGGALQLSADEPHPEKIAEQAFQQWKLGHTTNALALISEAIRVEPKEARWLQIRAQMHALMKQPEATIEDLGKAIELEPKSRVLLQGRGEELFKMGRVTDALKDFDQVNEIEPGFAPYNWQRGIALYFAGRFADGRRQFELHQTVNPHDVENAVWHFLCTAREKGINAARSTLIPIDGDDRVPMTQVHRLFAGKGTIEDILAAVKPDAATPELSRQQRFYAHLYLALYHEAKGEAALLASELVAAQPLGTTDDFMGHVARVMAGRVREDSWKAPATPHTP